MALDRIKYDITPYTKQLNLLDSLFYVERITADANTNGVSLMACIVFEAFTVNFGSLSNSARGMLEYTVNRLGPVLELEFTPIAAVDWYDLEMHVRPVDLGVKVTPVGRDTRVPGRTNNAAISLVFDILPSCFPEDARHLKPVARRMYLDMEGTMTPVLNFDDGSSTTLVALTHGSRQVADLNILTASRIKNVTLLGDFTDEDNILYDFEIDMMVPAQRRTAIG